jgi:hypothetical protein
LFISTSITGGTLVAMIFVSLFPRLDTDSQKMYENKSAIYPFLIVWTLLLLIIYCANKFFNLNNNTSNKLSWYSLLFIYIGITATLFIGRFFNIKLKYFNWRLTSRSFLLIFIVSIVENISRNIISKVLSAGIYPSSMFRLNSLNSLPIFLLNALFNAAYPGIFEEVLYRGFLISGLKGIGLSDEKCNVIQSIIFGIAHVMSWGAAPKAFILYTAAQAMAGYLLGKVYFKTKSLTPCILLHGLMNVI